MRRINIFASFIAAAIIAVSCGGPQKMADNASLVDYKVTPDPLETHGGKVAVEINVNYPEKYFHKKAIVTATPYLQYEGGVTELKSETLQGEQVEDNNKVISYTSGGSFSYSDEVDYQNEMMRSELYVKGKATVKKKEVDLPPIKIADGIITTPLLVNKEGEPILFGDNFKRIVPEEYVADIHYIINRYDVRNSELKQPDIANMGDYVKNAQDNDRVDLKGIEISAYASPDGPVDFNAELADDREGSASRFLHRDLRKYKVEVPDVEDFFSMMETPEDWAGFKTLMEESDIQDKDLILRVLSMYSDPVVREREIRNIAEAFEEIKVKILPKLRRSVFTVKTDKIGWSDQELRQWVTDNMDTLVLEELLYTASLFDDNPTKLKLYSKAMEKYPNCIRAANNVGVIKLAMKDLSGAKRAFETAKSIKDHNIVKNNLGVVALREGDIATAGQLFSAASGAGDEVNHNLAIIKIIQGDYDAAKSLLGSTQSYNNALVILLQGQPDKAYEMLRGLDTDNAMVDYLMAVAAARGDDKDAALDALRAAVAKNAKLKEHAAKDIEFAAYFEDEAFKGIVQ